ncbi:MAG: hypothetical protein ABSB11_02295 [Sedimentisphaerales bacterium]|jgi:hypothetical protein
MAIVAPVSKYKIKTFRIYIAFCVIVAAIFAYDGYLSKYEWSYRYSSFYTKHFIDKGNKPDGDMVFNQKAPPCIVGVAVLLGIYLFVIRNRKVVAEDNGLVIDGKTSIPYDSVQKIDKTNFDKKGHFTFTYKTPDGKEVDRKISERDYDNLKAILDHLVAKIS